MIRLISRNLKKLQPLCRHLFTTSHKLAEKSPHDKYYKRPFPYGTLLFLGSCYSYVIYLSFNSTQQFPIIKNVSWTEVYNLLSKNIVEKIEVRPYFNKAEVMVKKDETAKQQTRYFIEIADLEKFEENLANAQKQLNLTDLSIIYIRGDFSLITLLTLFIVMMLPLYAWQYSKSGNFNLTGTMNRANYTLINAAERRHSIVRLNDVAGLKDAKVEIMEFIDYLKNPVNYSRLGAKVPKGALLLGPPGCGKTLLAKAVSSEAQLPFLSMNGSEFMDAFGGLGAARVRDLFAEAQKLSPSIIYIDEIDAIGRQRSIALNENNNSEQEQTLNQLLNEMNGIQTKDGILVLASTNRAEILDRALLRPGRFDRHIVVELPSIEERTQIFKQHLKKLVLDQAPDVKRLAYMTPGFSGADIANVCNEAALHAVRLKHSAVSHKDLDYGIERLIYGLEKRNNTISPDEKYLVAYHESGHALVAWLLEHNEALLKISIIPRTDKTLGLTQYALTNRKLHTKEQLFDVMCMTMGGRVAEALICKRVTTAAQKDIKTVTNMAYAQVREYGMSDVIGPISFHKENGKPIYSKSLRSLMDYEASKLVHSSYLYTEELLKQNKGKLKLIAEMLIAKETLSYDDIVKLIGDPKHANKKVIKCYDLLK